MVHSQANKALFLDRDGVLIDYIPYLSRPDQVSLPQGAGPALRQWQEAGYLLIVITNQAGVGRGYFELAEMEAVHHCLRECYRAFGVTFTDIYFCPHHPDNGCLCRKPSPQMLIEASRQYNIVLTESYFLGDAPSDLQAALNAGCRPLLVRTGRGEETMTQLSQFPVTIPVFKQIADTLTLLSHGSTSEIDLTHS